LRVSNQWLTGILGFDSAVSRCVRIIDVLHRLMLINRTSGLVIQDLEMALMLLHRQEKPQDKEDRPGGNDAVNECQHD
jgi:hypothetical protein